MRRIVSIVTVVGLALGIAGLSVAGVAQTTVQSTRGKGYPGSGRKASSRKIDRHEQLRILGLDQYVRANVTSSHLHKFSALIPFRGRFAHKQIEANMRAEQFDTALTMIAEGVATGALKPKAAVDLLSEWIFKMALKAETNWNEVKRLQMQGASPEEIAKAEDKALGMVTVIDKLANRVTDLQEIMQITPTTTEATPLANGSRIVAALMQNIHANRTMRETAGQSNTTAQQGQSTESKRVSVPGSSSGTTPTTASQVSNVTTPPPVSASASGSALNAGGKTTVGGMPSAVVNAPAPTPIAAPGH